MNVFSPAAALLDRFRFPIKFSIIFTLVLIPMLILSSILFKDLAEQKRFLENERNGLAYMKVVRVPIEHIQQHRGMMSAYLNGDTSFRQALNEKSKAIDADFALLQQTDTELGASLQTQGKLKPILDAWDKLKTSDEQLKPAEPTGSDSLILF